MVKTAAGKSETLLSSVEALDAVEEAHIVAGDWDIIVEADAAEVYDLIHTAAGAIQDLEGVVDTKTYVSMD